MNDDALFSLRQDPSPEFSRALRTRLHEQDVALADTRRSRVRVILKPLLAAAVVGALFALPAVRASAQSLLSLFRLHTFLAVPVDRSRFAELTRQVDVENLIGGQVTVVQEPGSATAVESIDAASARVGFTVNEPRALPEGSTLLRVQVTGPGALKVTADAMRLQQLMDALSLDDLSVPAGLDGQTVNVETSPVVFALYSIPGVVERLRLAQSPVPDVQLPANVDMAALGEIGLRILGLGKNDAHALAQAIDWKTTLLVPIPADAASIRQVDVNGTSALLVERSRDNQVPLSMLLWSAGGRAYVMNGEIAGDQLTALAASVR